MQIFPLIRTVLIESTFIMWFKEKRINYLQTAEVVFRHCILRVLSASAQFVNYLLGVSRLKWVK